MASSEHVKSLIANAGKYEVLAEFHEGANGYAFKAQHRHLESTRFVKVIDADPEAERTFAEPKALMDAVSSGACENLVRLYDAEHLGAEFILMATEFVEGGSLQAFIDDRYLGQMDSVRVTLGILAGLGHLHAARFLHRDVKPGNILVSRSPILVPKLGDFGSVRRLEGDASSVKASRHSALYRPAEAWGDDGWFNFTSDLYQAALCLYEMVNGPLPYDFEKQLDGQARRELKARRVSFSELDPFDKSKLVDACLERRVKKGALLEMRPPEPYLSARLMKIIRKATSPLALERYQNAFEFTNVLQAFSAPNWKVSPVGFVASAWQSWDWRVTQIGSSKKGQQRCWAVARAKHGTGGFRAFGKPFGSPHEAFRAVENFRK